MADNSNKIGTRASSDPSLLDQLEKANKTLELTAQGRYFGPPPTNYFEAIAHRQGSEFYNAQCAAAEEKRRTEQNGLTPELTNAPPLTKDERDINDGFAISMFTTIISGCAAFVYPPALLVCVPSAILTKYFYGGMSKSESSQSIEQKEGAKPSVHDRTQPTPIANPTTAPHRAFEQQTKPRPQIIVTDEYARVRDRVPETVARKKPEPSYWPFKPK